MNFFAHVSIASLFAANEAMGLGAMLPDFAGFLRVRAPNTEHPDIVAGYALHHATDTAFHEHRAFRAACSEEALKLRSLGFDRGPALAIAHIGLEFLLDEALASDEPSRKLFRASLLSAEPQGLARSLVWKHADCAIRFEELRQRLLNAAHPRSGLAPAVIAARVFRTLRERPRLAIRSDDTAGVEQWLTTAKVGNAGLIGALVEEVVAQLSCTLPFQMTRTLDSLRFRRA